MQFPQQQNPRRKKDFSEALEGTEDTQAARAKKEIPEKKENEGIQAQGELRGSWALLDQLVSRS
jgi:hypothetical protein